MVTSRALSYPHTICRKLVVDLNLTVLTRIECKELCTVMRMGALRLGGTASVIFTVSVLLSRSLG